MLSHDVDAQQTIPDPEYGGCDNSIVTIVQDLRFKAIVASGKSAIMPACIEGMPAWR